MQTLAALAPAMAEVGVLVDVSLVEADQAALIPLGCGQQEQHSFNERFAPFAIGAAKQLAGIIKLAALPSHGSLSVMAHASNPYRGFPYPAEVIQHAVWLYHCFSLSLRNVETILAVRGIMVSYETIRAWGLRFGCLFANELKRRRPRPGDKWFLDEILILSANSGGLGQGCERRHACLGPWPSIQLMHYP